MDAMTIFLEQASQHKILSEPEVRRLCRRAQQGDEQARHDIVRAHVRLAVYAAKRFHRAGGFLDMGDLIQQACLGLLHAIVKFDPDRCSRGRRVRFMTYAHYWILHYMRREMQNHGRTIALPVGAPSHLHPSWVALDARQATLDEEPLSDWLAGTAESLEESYAHREAAGQVRDLLERLPVREQFVVRERYGLEDGGSHKSLREVGLKMNISSERTRQLECSALRRLRSYAQSYTQSSLPGRAQPSIISVS